MSCRRRPREAFLNYCGKGFYYLELGGNWKSDSSFLITEICNVAVYTWANFPHILENQCRERGTFRVARPFHQMGCTVPPSSLFSSWKSSLQWLIQTDLSPLQVPLLCHLHPTPAVCWWMVVLNTTACSCLCWSRLGFSLLAVDAQDRMHPVMKGNHAQCSSK